MSKDGEILWEMVGLQLLLTEQDKSSLGKKADFTAHKVGGSSIRHLESKQKTKQTHTHTHT